MTTRFVLRLALCLTCLLALIGCGAGTTTTTTPTPAPIPPTLPITISVSPTSTRVLAGATQQFTASVLNATRSDVIWQVERVNGGNATVGTISITGLYTAPVSVIPNSRVTITAIAAADGTKSASAAAFLGAQETVHSVYVSSAIDNTIEVFTADSYAGVLTARPTVGVGAGKGPTALAVHPGGRFLYSLNRTSHDISIFSIDPSTGDLALVGNTTVPDGPYQMVFTARGEFAYVSCDTAQSVAAYAVNPTTGALTPIPGSPYAMGSGTLQGLALSPDGKSLYVTNRDSGLILGMAVDDQNGTLTRISGSPFSAGAGPASIAANASVVFVANRDDNSVASYQRDPSSGVLSKGISINSHGGSPELFSNLATGFVLGVNTQSGGVFAFGYDNQGDLDDSYPVPPTGKVPLAGGLLVNADYYSWAYVLNRPDSSSSTGSIAGYFVTYDGAAGPKVTIPTQTNSPSGIAVTP